MTDILIIVCIILCILNAIFLIALLLKKRKEGDGAAMEKLKKMEEKTDAVGKLAEYNARTLERLERSTEARLVNIQNRLTDDIKYVVDVNAQNLERIRRTVDDKLTSSIDGKLSDSFARITERLEKMYESVGEMKGLSSSVADIRRVFTNVKLRGTWAKLSSTPFSNRCSRPSSICAASSSIRSTTPLPTSPSSCPQRTDICTCPSTANSPSKSLNGWCPLPSGATRRARTAPAKIWSAP